MMRRFQPRGMRSGVTLIELLVVGTLMLTLAAVSVPAIKPMMESQMTASAASTVSTYLNRARARAMTTGRPCGVTFELFDGTCDDCGTDDPSDDMGSACLVLRQIEVPPFYSGLEPGACVTVQPGSGNDFIVGDPTGLGPDPDSQYFGMRVRRISYINDPYWNYFVSSENSPSIQFNHCGPFYPLYFYNNEPFIVKLPGIELPSRLETPFCVKRDPRPTMTSPIGLPQGAVVDLEYSGDETSGFALGGDVTVVFAPSGEVLYVEDVEGQFVPTEPLYFLVGRWDRISALGCGEDENGEWVTFTEDGLWNYEDGSNFWVSINPRTGLVSTNEVNQPVNYTSGEDEESQKIFESREFARMSKRNLGGH